MTPAERDARLLADLRRHGVREDIVDVIHADLESVAASTADEATLEDARALACEGGMDAVTVWDIGRGSASVLALRALAAAGELAERRARRLRSDEAKIRANRAWHRRKHAARLAAERVAS